MADTSALPNSCSLPQHTDPQSAPPLPDLHTASLHWYDLTCPFCYIAQHRNAILLGAGIPLQELPFQAHPEVPAAGLYLGPRSGPMYVTLEREASAAGLPLRFPDRLPNSRLALAAAEWVRRHQPARFLPFQHDLFAAHFARNQDLGDPAVLDSYAHTHGLDLPALHASLQDGSAFQAVASAEALGASAGVRGTPAWLLRGRLISGLLPAAEFEQLSHL